MLVVNLFAAPGAGKSTTAAAVFAALKNLNYNVELVREVAKDLIYEGNPNLLQNQFYVSACQYKRLKDIETSGQNVDLVITDSPILLGGFYARENNLSYSEELIELIGKLHSSFNNYNVYLNRTKPYNGNGRVHSEAESDEIAKDLYYFITARLVLGFNLQTGGNTFGQDLLTKRLVEYLEKHK